MKHLALILVATVAIASGQGTTMALRDGSNIPTSFADEWRDVCNLVAATGINSSNGPVVAVNSGASTLTWAGLMAQMSVEASSARHGLIVRSPAGTGASIVGWSSSGAAAGKFYQDTNYTSSALYVIRATSSEATPTMTIAANSGNASDQALQVTAIGSTTPSFTLRYDGGITSSGTISAELISSSVNVMAAGVVTGGLGVASNGYITANGIISGSNFPANARIMTGNGAPTSDTATNGTIYINMTGNATTTLWIRAGGQWVAK